MPTKPTKGDFGTVRTRATPGGDFGTVRTRATPGGDFGAVRMRDTSESGSVRMRNTSESGSVRMRDTSESGSVTTRSRSSMPSPAASAASGDRAQAQNNMDYEAVERTLALPAKAMRSYGVNGTGYGSFKNKK